MTTDTVLTPQQIEALEKEHLWAHAQNIGAGEAHIEGADEFARAIEQAVLQSPEVQRLREMAKFGEVAMEYDKRARWHNEGDPAASVCNDFAQAMKFAFNEIMKEKEKP